jgi:hypothetical protein
LERAPDKQNVFLRKIMKRMADLGEVFNEVSIEVCKANETLHIFKAFGNGPINDGFDFNWIYRDLAMTDN